MLSLIFTFLVIFAAIMYNSIEGIYSRMVFILCPVRIHSNVQRAGAFDYRLRRTFFLKDECARKKGTSYE